MKKKKKKKKKKEKKRCPNGTRRNKVTGECDSIKKPLSKLSQQSKTKTKTKLTIGNQLGAAGKIK